MASLRELNLNRVKYVHVFVKDLQSPLIYTCYEQDEGAWKEEDGIGWAHVVQMVKHPAADFEPRWTRTVSLEQIERVDILSLAETLASRFN